MGLSLLLVVGLAASASVLSAQAPEAIRLVAAANVRLRVAPSEEVRIVATVPLGAELVELGLSPDGHWVRVRTSDAVEGWIHDRLTVRVPRGQRLAVAERLIGSRLHRTGDGFAAWRELEAFVSRTARGELADRETEARFALYRLKALAGAAISGGFGRRPRSAEFAAWIDERRTELVYNEPGGRWMLRRDAIFAEYDRFPTERAGDEIAWLAVTTGLPGECEGDVTCYLTRDDLTFGEYLRRRPTGTFVAPALRDLRDRLTYYREDLVGRPGFFDRTRDCPELVSNAARLRGAIDQIPTAEAEADSARQRALASLTALLADAGCSG